MTKARTPRVGSKQARKEGRKEGREEKRRLT